MILIEYDDFIVVGVTIVGGAPGYTKSPGAFAIAKPENFPNGLSGVTYIGDDTTFLSNLYTALQGMTLSGGARLAEASDGSSYLPVFTKYAQSSADVTP